MILRRTGTGHDESVEKQWRVARRRALENALGDERERVRELQRAPKARLVQLVRHACKR